MLERNRGARRDRDRSKKVPALRALAREAVKGWYANKSRQELERLFLRNGGRDSLRDHKCLDCIGWVGICEWCKGGSLRKQRRLHDSLDADFKAWKFSGQGDG